MYIDERKKWSTHLLLSLLCITHLLLSLLCSTHLLLNTVQLSWGDLAELLKLRRSCGRRHVPTRLIDFLFVLFRGIQLYHVPLRRRSFCSVLTHFSDRNFSFCYHLGFILAVGTCTCIRVECWSVSWIDEFAIKCLEMWLMGGGGPF